MAQQDELDMAALTARIGGVAQELQDMILDYTLTSSAEGLLSGEIVINKDYRPPWQLQLNSRSRKVFAKWYYKHNIFRADILQGLRGKPVWLYLIGAQNRATVVNFRAGSCRPITDTPEKIKKLLRRRPNWFTNYLVERRRGLQEAEQILVERKCGFRGGVLRVSCRVLEKDFTVSRVWLSTDEMEEKLKE